MNDITQTTSTTMSNATLIYTQNQNQTIQRIINPISANSPNNFRK